MKIKVTERSGETGKIGDFLNYEVELNLGDPGFLEQFFKEREKALLRYSERREKAIESIRKGDRYHDFYN